MLRLIDLPKYIVHKVFAKYFLNLTRVPVYTVYHINTFLLQVFHLLIFSRAMFSLQIARCSGRSIISFIGARSRLANINNLPKRLCSSQKMQEMKQDYKVNTVRTFKGICNFATWDNFLNQQLKVFEIISKENVGKYCNDVDPEWGPAGR